MYPDSSFLQVRAAHDKWYPISLIKEKTPNVQNSFPFFCVAPLSNPHFASRVLYSQYSLRGSHGLT